MMHPIKLQIKIRRPFGNDWVRFYEVDRMLIDSNCFIKTEAQLAYYIYKKHGIGRYQVLAWTKGHEGFWMYWLGDLYENGFIRDKRKNKNLDKLKGDFNKAKTYEEKVEVEEEMTFEREINEIEKTIAPKRGPVGLKTCRPGQLHNYEEF